MRAQRRNCLAAVALLFQSATLAAQGVTPQAPFVAESATLASATGMLRGTLLAPVGGPPVPVVLIHPGSGPTDRDGNSALLPGKNDGLRLLAEGLAVRDIATLRIDKRGVAASAAATRSEADLRLETYVEDAVGWLSLLRRDRRFSHVLVLGHSEGALIGALAGARVSADGYISLAGPARRGSAVLRRQLGQRLSGPLARENERILSALEQGEFADSVPAQLMALYRPSVQPYLISWFRYEPVSEVRRLTMPVLIVQGTTDRQVDTTDAAALHAARPDATYLRIAGMNHVLKVVDGGRQQQLASYSDSTLPVAPALLDGLAAFIHALRLDPSHR
jgi:pimeloyl-ACP methyl ester carboxylesterase